MKTSSAIKVEINGRTVAVRAEKSSINLSFGGCSLDLLPRQALTNCKLEEIYQAYWRKRGFLYLKSKSFEESVGDGGKPVKKPIYIYSNKISVYNNVLGEYLVIVTSGYHSVDRIILYKSLLVLEFSGSKEFVLEERMGKTILTLTKKMV